MTRWYFRVDDMNDLGEGEDRGADRDIAAARCAQVNDLGR